MYVLFIFIFKVIKITSLKKKKNYQNYYLAMSTGSILAYSKTGNGICYFLEATKKEPYPFKIKIYILKKKKKNTDHSLSLLSHSNYWFPSSMASLIQFLLLCCSLINLFIFTLTHISQAERFQIPNALTPHPHQRCYKLQPSNTCPKFIMALYFLQSIL